MPCACQVPIPKYPDSAEWGPILWTILHGFAERAGRGPLPADEIREWQKFLKLTGEMLPCDKCREHFSRYSKQSHLTQMTGMAPDAVRAFIRGWIWTLHNEVNREAGKPAYPFDTVSETYRNVNFQDQLWRLDPVIKKAITINGSGLLKYTAWTSSFKMLRSLLA